MTRAGTQPVIVTAGVLALTSSTTVFLHESTGPSVALRALGVALLVVAAGRAQGTSERRAAWVPGLFLAMGLYLVVGSFFHGRWAAGVVSLVTALVIATATTRWARGLDPAVLLTAVRRVLTATVGGSLVLGIVLPTTAVEQDRLRGWYENANTLGFAALALGTVAVLRPVRPLPTVVALASATAALAWSASRTSALAFVLVVAVALLARWSTTTAVTTLTVAALASCLLLLRPDLLDALDGLRRDTDSRSSTTDLALHVLDLWPTIGIGIGAEEGVHVSSPLVALIHAGLPGLLSVGGMGVALSASAWGRGWRSWLLVAALLLHSTSESWLLSPTSPLLLTALCLVFAVSGTDPPPPGRSRAGSTAPTAHRPRGRSTPPPPSHHPSIRPRHLPESPCPRTSSSSPRTSPRPRPVADRSAASPRSPAAPHQTRP